MAQGTGYRLALSPGAATFQLARRPAVARSASSGKERQSKNSFLPGETLTMQLAGADASAHAVQNAGATGHANYFLGRDHSKWRTDVPLYNRVTYRQVYQGVDLVYYGNQRQLEYDFLVRPGVDPKRIALKFGGAKTVRLAANGDLVLGLKQDEVRWHKPLTYQIVAGKKRMVASSFVLKKGGKVGFSLARYDTSRALTIDPTLVYSNLSGGAAFTNSLAVDSAGNTYIGGWLDISNLPVTPGAYQTAPRGAFVAKLNPTGTAFVYATYLGGAQFSNVNGTDDDRVSGIAIDSAGNAYLTGSAESHDFPVTPGAFQTTNFVPPGNPLTNVPVTCFVTKLNATGSALIYSTYLGGHTTDRGKAIAIDSQGNAYITGGTGSTDFPTTPGAFQRTPSGAFITKLNPTGTALVYSTYLGGSAGGEAEGIALDSAGNAYVTGSTEASDFPVTPGAFQTTNHKQVGSGSPTVFVTKLNAVGAALLYSTYLGGSHVYGEQGLGIAVDPFDNAYVTGTTFSVDFPTTPGAFQATAPSGNPLIGTSFVTKLNLTGTGLAYSTYMGRSSNIAIAVDSAGRACVTGYAQPPNFPTTVGAFNRQPGQPVASVMKLNATGTALLYSTYLPGSQIGNSVALDNQGIATVAGQVLSNGSNTENLFVTRLSTNPIFPDFNADGNTDLLLKNQNTGVIGTWLMHGSHVLGIAIFSQIPLSTYTLVGVGDFRGDGAATLVFQNSADNRIVVWYTGGVNTAVITGGDYIHRPPDPGWNLVGIADFNQDGRSDLLFQNPTTGSLVIWNMNGLDFQSGVSSLPANAPDWKVVGTGDFNGDGFPDIVFQSRTTGKIKIWFMNGTAVAGAIQLASVPLPGWSVVGVGDYNGDGTADLLFQNQTTNQAVVWYMNNGVMIGGSLLSQTPQPGWKIVGPH